MNDAIFSNDLVGYFKLLAAIAVSASSVGGLLGFWLKKRDDARWERFQTTINGLGQRVDETAGDIGLHSAWAKELDKERIRVHAEMTAMRDRLTRTETSVELIERNQNAHHRDLMDAVHKVELQVAKLSERSNIGDAIMELAVALRTGKDR